MTMIAWQNIIIHHSLTKDGMGVSWGAIRRYHTGTLGWQDIGYHFGVEMVNDYYEVLLGRSLDSPGAHTRGMNKTSIGICCVGNYDLIEPPERLLHVTAGLIKTLMQIFAIPIANIFPHREFASYKSCPGSQFNTDIFKAQYLLPGLQYQ